MAYHRRITPEEEKEIAAPIFLSRRSGGEGECSMSITEDVRKYAAEQGITEEAAIEEGLKQKAKEFNKAGADTNF